MKLMSVVFLGFGLFVLSSEAADNPRMVSVSGSCIRNVIPDRGAVTLTSEARDSDSKRAQVAANRSYEAVRSKAVALKLPDAEISTAEYTSEEVREWEKDRLVSRGFRTRIALKVETSDTARLGEVIEIGSREGIKQISTMNLFVSTKKMLAEKMLCLKEASEQAKSKAEALAGALGARVGEVLVIQENSNTSVPELVMPMMKGAMVSAMDASPAPKIEAGRVELSTTVNVSFGLK